LDRIANLKTDLFRRQGAPPAPPTGEVSMPAEPRASLNAEKELFRAVKAGNSTRVQELLQADPSLVHAADAAGGTPLHHAAWNGPGEVARLLLAAGADVNAQSRNTHYGGTPLHAAAHGNQRAVAGLLLARRADPRARSGNDRTPLQETTIH